jgi:histidinol-phosphate/aromatic aminotransferase/cobyric acid decarboxylase-like protein
MLRYVGKWQDKFYEKFPENVINKGGNFILFRSKRASELFEKLRYRGIAVTKIDKSPLQDCIKFSISSSKIMKRIMRILND